MRVLLSECPEGHKKFSFEESPEALELGLVIDTRGPVTVDLDVERRGNQLVLRGLARVGLVTLCARCAQSTDKVLQGEILAFADRRGKDREDDEAALEQEGSILYHDGIELTLTDTVREAILLEEPVRVLCSEDCKGLCQKCGEDLNQGPCGCPAMEPDTRWDVLKKLNPGDS